MPDFPSAIEYYVDPSRTFIGQNSQTAIVCHGTGGNPNQTAQQLGDFFRTTPSEVSVHYGIDRAGVICQYVPESAGAGGNGILDPGYDPFWDQFGGDNPNIHTLSFETINDSTNSLSLTEPQKQTVFKLVKYWINKYDIPLTNIKSHASLEPVNRARCPGPNFPWTELMKYLQGGNKPVPTKPNANQQKAADDCWDSFLKNIGTVGVAPKGSTIYQQWIAGYVSGAFYGPPLTHEYDSVDWNGGKIVAQEFAHARCEYSSGVVHWYGLNGKIS